MARNRVIYQSEAIFVNKNAGELDGYDQLERVQSANYSFSINRQDINQYGQLGKLDSIILDAPTVTADVSYYVSDGFTERALGFLLATGQTTTAKTVGGFVSGMLADGSGANIMVLTTPEGTDADLPSRNPTGAANSAIGIGNAYVSNYSVDMSVGSIPTASVSFDALNITSDAVGSTYATPAIDPVNGTAEAGDVLMPTPRTGQGDIAALRPGNITVDVSNFDSEDTLINIGTNVDGAHIQSASLSVPMSRSTLERLGSRAAFARTVDFPIVASLSVSAIVNEVEAANLADIIDDESEKTITLTMKEDSGATGIIYTLKGCSLDSESISSSIGSNKTVDLTFSTSVGGPGDTAHGVFMSGSSSTPLNGAFAD